MTEQVTAAAAQVPMPVSAQIPQQPRDAITVEIESRENLSNILNGILYPQENQDAALAYLNRLFTSCTKFVWDRRLSGDCDPSIRVEGYTNNAGMFELEGPAATKYLWSCCCCQFGQLSLDFTHQGVPFLNFSHTPEMCTAYCFSGMKQINVFVPGRLEPIGKLKYTNGSFTSDIVTITNLVTGETFTASPGVSRDSDLPNMHVQNQAGTTVAICGVTRAHIYRGTTTYTGVEVQFVPEVGMASTTKALMIIFGSALQMDKQHKNMCKFFISLFIGLFIGLVIVLVTHSTR